MNKNKISIGIMGTGHMASIMAKTIKKMKDVDCVSVASEDEDRAIRFSKKHKIKKYYFSYQQMVDNEKVDLIYIATLNRDHKKCALMCIEKKIPIFLEKPFGMNNDDVQTIVSAAKKKNVFVAEAMLHFYSGLLKIVCETLNNGSIGKPILFEASLGIAIHGLKRVRTKELGGGAALDLGCYLVSLSDILLGEQASFVRKSKIDLDTLVDTRNEYQIEYVSGAKALLIDSIDTHYCNEGILYCEKGYIKIYGTYNISKVEIVGDTVKKEYTRKGNGYSEELERIVSIIRSSNEYHNNMDETLCVSKVIEEKN